MDTQTIIKAKYGISKRDLHTVPTWAKNEQLARTVSYAEMWHMGDADVKKREKYSLGRLKAVFKRLFRRHIIGITASCRFVMTLSNIVIDKMSQYY